MLSGWRICWHAGELWGRPLASQAGRLVDDLGGLVLPGIRYEWGYLDNRIVPWSRLSGADADRNARRGLIVALSGDAGCAVYWYILN